MIVIDIILIKSAGDSKIKLGRFLIRDQFCYRNLYSLVFPVAIYLLHAKHFFLVITYWTGHSTCQSHITICLCRNLPWALSSLTHDGIVVSLSILDSGLLLNSSYVVDMDIPSHHGFQQQYCHPVERSRSEHAMLSDFLASWFDGMKKGQKQKRPV